MISGGSIYSKRIGSVVVAWIVVGAWPGLLEAVLMSPSVVVLVREIWMFEGMEDVWIYVLNSSPVVV